VKHTVTPQEIAQGQLDAYNKQDIDQFLSWYTNDVEIYNFPNKLVYSGIDEMRKRYTEAWKQNPNQKAAVTERVVLGNTVIDKEHVTGRSNNINVEVIAIYKIAGDKISQVYFIRD
jgi:hypothetical protein